MRRGIVGKGLFFGFGGGYFRVGNDQRFKVSQFRGFRGGDSREGKQDKKESLTSFWGEHFYMEQ